MDPLSALAIATAVVQFAEFGGKILLRTWSRYKGRLAEEEDVQVSKLVDDLSGLSNSVRDRTEGFWEDSAASPSELHLSRICSECDSVTAEFRDVLGQLSRRRKAKKDTKLEQLVLAGLWDDRRIKQMADRLEILRQQVMTAILFCLWHDSKRAQQRELHFATQLNGILEIVQRVDDSISQRSDSNTPSQLANQPSSWTPVVNGIMDIVVESGHPETLKPPDAAGRVRERTSTMATTILPIIEAGKAVSISRIGEEVVKALSKSESAKQIRDDLVQILWTKEWTLDTSTVSASKMKIHTQLDVAVISKTVCVGLMFQGMTIREGAIAKAFESTYEWIFSREPKKLDGKLLWDSFPDWLESNTNTPYWLSGKPGSGKSTIIKFMANNSHLKRHLSKWAGPLPVFLSTYYAWNSGFSMQKTWEGLKRTVLYQVIEQSPSLIPIIAPRRWVLVQALRDPTAALPQWISWEIDEAFEALLSECGRSMRLVLFVDGLDEFEMPPSEVVARIRSLSRRAGDGIKMCVASRPWTEFDDTLSEGPMLQMHLLTHNDITSFVRKRFHSNRGFTELQHIYPSESEQLIQDVVDKARGVFLWVSLVVDALLEFLTAGESIGELQDSLEQLPSDLSSVYDAILARIPDRHGHDASVMIQLVRASRGPIPWLLMWLAEESRSRKVDINSMGADNRYYAQRSLRRRLATRTRGILELTNELNPHVTFSHRTARDWAVQDHVWSKICSACKTSFDPYLELLRAQSLFITDESKTTEYFRTDIWNIVETTLWYASQVTATRSENKAELVEYLDDFDVAMGKLFGLAAQHWPSVYMPKNAVLHWSSAQDFSTKRRELANSYLGLTAQFSILPYIMVKISAKPRLLSQKHSKEGLGLLENAVFGYGYYMEPVWQRKNGSLEIACAQRLDTVRFFLDQGLDPSKEKVHSPKGEKSLKEAIRDFKAEGDGEEYWCLVEKELARQHIPMLTRLTRHFRSSSSAS